jgi:aminoglycoside phosphotransferase family enzyme
MKETIQEVADPLIRALCDPAVYDHDVEAVRVIETHISWILLTGSYAYKIKKLVRFRSVDFSRLRQRRSFCEEELRLNQRLAPDLYLDVVPIGGSIEHPVIGAQPAIEYAVKLREFPAGARLDERLQADEVSVEDIRNDCRRMKFRWRTSARWRRRSLIFTAHYRLPGASATPSGSRGLH